MPSTRGSSVVRTRRSPLPSSAGSVTIRPTIASASGLATSGSTGRGSGSSGKPDGSSNAMVPSLVTTTSAISCEELGRAPVPPGPKGGPKSPSRSGRWRAASNVSSTRSIIDSRAAFTTM